MRWLIAAAGLAAVAAALAIGVRNGGFFRITYLSHVVTYRVTAAKTKGSYYAWQARPD